MNEENAKKESKIELIKHQLSNIYYKRAFDEDFNRGIRVIDSNKMIVSAKRYHHSGVSSTIVSLKAVPL